MNGRVTFFAIWCFSAAIALSAKTALPQGLTDAVAKTGAPYRNAVAAFIKTPGATEYLKHFLDREHADTANARQARILLARIQHTEVFTEFDNEIRKWREGGKSSKPYGGRPGLLFSYLCQFTMRGPESKVIEVDAGWEPLPARADRQPSIIMRQRSYEQVEKYADAEVAAGIARNAAARQAVLEHFLKFLGEDDACEQGEMIWLLDHLWGRSRITRTRDLAVIDHVQDAETLIEAVFQDASHSTTARMRAALCLTDDKRPEVRAFMLDVVTNTPPEDACHQSEEMVSRALAYLELSADATMLAVLKSQTNGPTWKREKIERAIHAIEGILSAPSQDK